MRTIWKRNHYTVRLLCSFYTLMMNIYNLMTAIFMMIGMGQTVKICDNYA